MRCSPLVSTVALLSALGCGGRESGTTALANSSGAGPNMDSSEVGDAKSGVSAMEASIPKIHRTTPSSCTQPRSGDGDAGVYCGFFLGEVPSEAGACQYDTDCTAGVSGRCACAPPVPGIGAATACSYDACQSDRDCSNGSSGSVCDCREGPLGNGNQSAANVCLAGNCRTDADCGSAGYCSPSNVPGCGPNWWYGYFCHTANDTCTNDTDCPGPNGICATYGNAWHCYPSPCADGGV
jgi:hypothetical protein